MSVNPPSHYLGIKGNHAPTEGSEDQTTGFWSHDWYAPHYFEKPCKVIPRKILHSFTGSVHATVFLLWTSMSRPSILRMWRTPASPPTATIPRPRALTILASEPTPESSRYPPNTPRHITPRRGPTIIPRSSRTSRATLPGLLRILATLPARTPSTTFRTCVCAATAIRSARC